MSIYIYTKKLREMLKGERYHLPDEESNSIVASLINGKKPHILKLENYTEDKLVDLVLSHGERNLFIDYRFWNYKYCSPKQLRVENLTYLYPNKNILVEPEPFYVGMVVVMIMYYQLFYYTYLIEDEELYKVYLQRINIDRRDLARYMTSNHIQLPLTTNYLHLLKRVFTNENIGDFLITNINLKPDEMRTILEEFEIIDLRHWSKIIFENEKYTLLDKYLLFEVILDLYDGSIDHYSNVFMTNKMEYKPVGYYLENSPDNNDLDSLRESLLETYLLKDGARQIVTI